MTDENRAAAELGERGPAEAQNENEPAAPADDGAGEDTAGGESTPDEPPAEPAADPEPGVSGR